MSDQTTLDESLLINDAIRKFSLWKFLALLLACLISIPLVYIILSLFKPEWAVWQHLFDTVLLEYVINSCVLMCAVALLSLVMGVAAAWLTCMCEFPASRYFSWLLLLPMAMPAYIIAYSYTGLLDVAGPLQSGLREMLDLGYGEYWFPEIRSLAGASWLMSMVLYPYVYLFSRATFLQQSVCVLEVSRTLGCGFVGSFFRVALPLARPAVLVGVALVMMETLADYGTVQYFGIPVFTTGIFRTWFGLGNSLVAAQLSALMLAFVVALVWLEQYSRGQSRYYHSSNRYREINLIKLSKLQAVLATLFCGSLLLIGFIIPFLHLLSLAWQSQQSLDATMLDLIKNSFVLALITAMLAILLALFFAYGKRRHPQGLMPSIVRLVGLGYALPGTIIAVGVVLPFASLDSMINNWLMSLFHYSPGQVLGGGLLILVFSYLVRFLAVSVNGIDTALLKVKPNMDDSARTLGKSDTAILRQIHMPMIKGSILTACLLVFVDVLKELPATLILRPFNFNTLAVRTFEMANEERLADAALPALLIVLAGVLPVIILSRAIDKSRPGMHART